MKKWLRDEWVVLTGASSGIGRELTKILIAKYRAKVVGIGRSEEKLRALKEEFGEAFAFLSFDVSQKEEWKTLASFLQGEALTPALLINNAGVFPPLQRTESITEEVLTQTLRTNFLATVYAVESVAPLLKKEKKASGIVNICSSAALCPVVGSAAYSASKGALKAYTEALQLESERYVGLFFPGTTATELFRSDENVQGSAMRKIASPPARMAKKIAKKIIKRKKRAVLGWDAKLMNFTAKLMPVKGPALIRSVMKLSKSQAFDGVFDKKKGE